MGVVKGQVVCGVVAWGRLGRHTHTPCLFKNKRINVHTGCHHRPCPGTHIKAAGEWQHMEQGVLYRYTRWG